MFACGANLSHILECYFVSPQWIMCLSWSLCWSLVDISYGEATAEGNIDAEIATPVLSQLVKSFVNVTPLPQTGSDKDHA